MLTERGIRLLPQISRDDPNGLVHLLNLAIDSVQSLEFIKVGGVADKHDFFEGAGLKVLKAGDLLAVADACFDEGLADSRVI